MDNAIIIVSFNLEKPSTWEQLIPFGMQKPQVSGKSELGNIENKIWILDQIDSMEETIDQIFINC